MDDPTFRRDLYRGTASFYDRYRVPYPPALIADLVDRIGADGCGRLLDLAAGTGQVSVPLASHFRQVIAVDQEPDMVRVGAENAARHGLTPAHFTWMEKRIEALRFPPAAFEVITVGNAFHRLSRDHTADLMRTWLNPGGYVALLWSDNPWVGARPWQRAVRSVVDAWLHNRPSGARVPAGYAASRAERPDAVILEAHGHVPVGRFSFPTDHHWTLESLLGFAYSTSVLSLDALGEERAQFDDDIRAALHAYLEAGGVSSVIPFAYELFRRP